MFRTEDKKPGVWTLMKPVLGRIWSGMILASLGTTFSLFSVAVLAMVVHVLITGEAILLLGYNWNIQSLVLLALGLIVLTILFRMAAFLISHFAAYHLEEIVRTDLSQHLAKMSLGEVLASGTGGLKKILLDDVRGLHVYVADTTPFMGRAVAGPIVTLILLFLIDWRLALATIAIMAFGLFTMNFALKDSVEIRQAYDDCNEEINSAAIEFVQAMPVVRTFDTGSSTFKRYHTTLIQFRKMLSEWVTLTSRAARFSIILLGPLPTLIAVSFAGVLLYSQGLISFSVLMAFWLLSTGVAESLMPLMWLMQMNRMAQVGAIRINDFLAKPPLPEVSEPQSPKDASIIFENVNFCYPNRTQLALSGASFKSAEGTITAVVGPSGSGKSTIARLIPRFYDVKEGSIRIGGVDVRNIPTDELMAQVSFVFQDTFLFHDTIMENIRIAKPGANDDEVKQAARQAMAHDFIMEMAEGYNTVAGDRGTRLSGGQRQRITIARAILRNAPILVLDEATAFADPENEAMIIQALATLMRGRTVLIIAHRLSTIRDADQILVLDHGKITESGKHDALVKSGGLYHRLWQNHEAAQGWRLRTASEKTLKKSTRKTKAVSKKRARKTNTEKVT
ncbi:MAG: ABC transporter ATP-binding protein [Pseudomonadota bacterium]